MGQRRGLRITPAEKVMLLLVSALLLLALISTGDSSLAVEYGDSKVALVARGNTAAIVDSIVSLAALVFGLWFWVAKVRTESTFSLGKRVAYLYLSVVASLLTFMVSSAILYLVYQPSPAPVATQPGPGKAPADGGAAKP